MFGKKYSLIISFVSTIGFSLISSVIIGSGIFISPSLVLREVHDVGVSLSIWLVSGMLALFGALSYVELATTIRKAGGSYTYVLYIYGPAPAFLISWTQSLLIDPTCISAITLSLGSYVAKPFANLIIVQPWHAKVIAACCILIMFLTNCTTTKAVTNLQTFINCAQISTIAFIIVVGVWQLSVGHTHHFKNAFGSGEFSPGRLGSYGTAFFGALWAYNGWNTIGNITEDMIDLEKTVFRTIISAVPFVICSYFVVNVAFLTVLPPDVIANSSTVAVDFVENVFGKDVAYFIPILVAVSCYGSANGNLFAASRVPMSAGREGHMPSLLGTIHRKRHTPIPALMLTTIIALFLLLPEGSNLESLINLASVSCMFVYGITILGVIVLRVKQPELYRPCKVWIILPGIMVVVFAALVVFAFFQRPGNSALAAGIILLGLPVYFVLVRPGKHLPGWLSRGVRKLTDVVKEKMNLVPCSA